MRRPATPKDARGSPVARAGFGILFVLGALVLLWHNEGRVNLADLAARSTAVSAGTLSPDNDNTFVSITGPVTTPHLLSDDRYLRPAPYLQINRFVEMYAWVETTDSDEDGTTASYTLDWTADPQPPTAFVIPEGHANPPLPVTDLTLIASSATLGAYTIDMTTVSLPRGTAVTPTLATMREGPYTFTGLYLFIGSGSLAAPVLGDVRVSFTAVPANTTMTLFAVAQGSRTTPYTHRDGSTLYRLLSGDRDTALARLHTEYRNLLWGFRAAGFAMIWAGLGLLLSPVTGLLAYVPVLGTLGNTLIRLLTLGLALLLSTIVILIAAIAHNLWLLLGVLLLLPAGFGLWAWQKQKAAAR